jgi:PEP-CTERM motif
MLLKKFFAAAICAAVCLGVTTNAQAILITSNGDFDLISAEDGVAPISDIKIISGAGATGRIFTNQVSGAVPFGLGSQIRTVSALAVGGATDGIQHTSVRFANGDILVIVSAIQGSITTVSASQQTATFTAGRAFAMRFAVGTFDSRNPASWAAGTVVAEYALKPQEDVFSGSPLGSDINYAAALTNQSSVNSATNAQTQGVFLFREDSQTFQTPGNNLMFNVDQSVIPPGWVFHSESLVSDIDQTLLFTDLENFELGANPGGLNAADLGILNAFAGAAGFGDLGGAGTGFATGLGGAGVADFNPQFPPGVGDVPTGDFFATYGADNYVAVQAVPEPSSMLLLTLGVGGLGLYRRIRGTKKA